jgi:hypothetical protein
MVNAIVFPADPFEHRKVDAEFQHEAQIVAELGGKVILVDHTELENEIFVGKNILTKAKAKEYSSASSDSERERLKEMLPTHTIVGENAFYRGWMLSKDAYELMHNELSARTIGMVSSPWDYMAGFWLSGWYEHFGNVTPASIWGPVNDFEDAVVTGDFIQKVQATLGYGPYIVKDQVKSRKHEWETACFAPDGHKLPDIAREFIRLQGESLAGGLVIREFEDFDKTMGETRVWWVNNKPVFQSPHPDTPEIFMPVDVSFLQENVNSFNRPFITTDLARRTDGTWRVMEVSDGQVSGTPQGFDVSKLFEALINAVV